MKTESVTRPRARRTRTDKAQTKERLISAAIMLFAQHGFEAVSTGMIAKQAGLTQSMVHYHFGNKLNLWKAAIESIMSIRGASFPISRLKELKDLDPLSRLKIMVRQFVLSNAADPNLTRIIIHEGMQRSPRLKWLATRYMMQGYGMFNGEIKAAVDAGQIRPLQVEHVTNIIVGAAGMVFSLRALLDEVYGGSHLSGEQVEEFCDTVIEVLFFGLELKPS
jgi:TetR/AcrR family transcriptional regulator